MVNKDLQNSQRSASGWRTYRIKSSQKNCRDAMHKRGLCRRAVSCCLFMTWRSCIVSKRVNIFSNFFHRR